MRLLELGPSVLWLFNHHQDSVAIAGVQPHQGYLLKYLHHGDHHLCLGVYLDFGEHFDPHPMGFHNCRQVLMRPDNRYLPLAVDDPGLPASADETGPLITCTAAGGNKLDHAYWPNYADVIPLLLAQTGGRHIHIGRLSWSYRRRIARGLRRAGVSTSAFTYIVRVKSVAAALQHYRVDLYLASFPYAGARTLVEVMAAGVPTAAHDHRSSRMLGAIDMLPPMSHVWVGVRELIEFIGTQTRESLKLRGKAARSYYEAHHTPRQLQLALAGDEAAQKLPLAGFVHVPDALALALETGWQFSGAGLLKRWHGRCVRRLKSAIS